MFASLPNTPYFRALTTTDVLDVTLTGEELLADDRVDFKKSSRQRRERIDIQDTVFYVSLEEIRRNYRPLADVLQKGSLPVTAEDLEVLIRHICPSTNGLYSEPLADENILPLLRISHKLELEEISQECRRFIYGNQIKQLSIVQMIEIFNFLVQEDMDTEKDRIGNVLHPVRSSLLKALLEHEDQNDLFCLMLNGPSSPCISVLKRAMKNLHTLEHNTSFVNSSIPISCHCPKEEISGQRLFERRARASTPVSLCGLVCSDCNSGFCSKCRKSLCPVKINQLLLAHEEAEKQPPVADEEELDILTTETFAYPSSSEEDNFNIPESSADGRETTPLSVYHTPIAYSDRVLHPPPPPPPPLPTQPLYAPAMAATVPPPGFSLPYPYPIYPMGYAPQPVAPPPPPLLLPVQSAPCVHYTQTVYHPIAQYQYSFSYIGEPSPTANNML